MKKAAFYQFDFVAKDGTPGSFNDDVLDRYDAFVDEEIRRHVEEDTPQSVMSEFVQRAAEHRVELMQFLDAPSHGPH